uniref:Uncharacterized protein n=1 Tax=Plectus sambesii TaxID=2011161 RepID=A0A914VK91_9BILA
MTLVGVSAVGRGCRGPFWEWRRNFWPPAVRATEADVVAVISGRNRGLLSGFVEPEWMRSCAHDVFHALLRARRAPCCGSSRRRGFFFLIESRLNAEEGSRRRNRCFYSDRRRVVDAGYADCPATTTTTTTTMQRPVAVHESPVGQTPTAPTSYRI